MFVSKVRFDDGDECDNIRPDQLYSEAAFRRLERKEPPKVIGDTSDAIQSHPLYSLGFCRQWIGKVLRRYFFQVANRSC
jgi:hypothetical protein